MLHVHDLVDWVCEESRRAGLYASQWLKGVLPAVQIFTRAGSHVRYVNMARIAPDRENHIYIRSMIVKADALIEVRLDGRVIQSRKERHVQPSEMIHIKINPKDFEGLELKPDSVVEFSIS